MISGGISSREVTWEFSGNRLTSVASTSPIDSSDGPACLLKQRRDWDMLRMTADRIYVHETITQLSDNNLDDEFEIEVALSRVNFYEKLSYYDLDDVDRDGYRTMKTRSQLMRPSGPTRITMVLEITLTQRAIETVMVSRMSRTRFLMSRQPRSTAMPTGIPTAGMMACPRRLLMVLI